MNIIDRIGEFQRFGSVLGLDRMKVLMELLGDPQEALKVIHVAGTNGKGSTCRYIYEALLASGKNVGLYTSPYIEKFNERIQYNGEMISDEELEQIGDRVISKAEEMISQGYESPTEFEIVTAIGLVYFKEKNADFVILEVGLGGRGDSTNIIEKPLVCVITSIGYDHMDRLGGTLSEIAFEKAGIIKEGIPVISNAEDEEAKKVIARTAYEKRARLIDVSKVKPVMVNHFLGGSISSFVLQGIRYDGIEICMSGEHQVKNLKCALSTIEFLRGKGYISLNRERFIEGIKRAKQPARFEIMKKEPYVILDGAHNIDGAEALKNAMKGYFDKSRVLMVCGMLKDKDVDGIVDEFAEISDNFIITEPFNPRKLDAEELSYKFVERGISCETLRSREEAFSRAMELRRDYDCVLFAGSLYLIGEIRRMCNYAC